MAHSLDTSARYPATANTSSTDNPVSFSYTCGSSATVLAIGIVGNTTSRSGTPTYNGVNMTQADQKRQAPTAPEGAAEIWYLLAPPTGSAYTISVPNSGTANLVIYVASFSAASGNTSSLDVANGAGGNSADPSVSVTTTANGDAIYAAHFNGHNSFNPSSPSGTQLHADDNGTWGTCDQYLLQTSSGTQAMSWVAASDDWGLVAVAFKEVSSGPVVSVSDSVTVSEAVTIGPLALAGVSITEATITVGEAVAMLLSISIAQSEAVTVGEAVAVGPVSPLDISASDAITVGEAAALGVAPHNISVSDLVTVGDAATVQIPVEAELSISVSDLVTVGESITLAAVYPLNISVSDLVTVTDTPTVVRQVEGELTISVSDSITVGEQASLQTGGPVISVSDSITVSDLASLASLAIAVSISETVTLGEAVTVNIGHLVLTVLELVTVSEAVTVAGLAGPVVARGKMIFVAYREKRTYSTYRNKCHAVEFRDKRDSNQ